MTLNHSQVLPFSTGRIFNAQGKYHFLVRANIGIQPWTLSCLNTVFETARAQQPLCLDERANIAQSTDGLASHILKQQIVEQLQFAVLLEHVKHELTDYAGAFFSLHKRHD